MRSNLLWKEQFNDREGSPLCMYDVVFSPDNNHVAATAGTNIYIYNSKDGILVTSLKNHRETVLALAYSLDGRRFASGSADKQVIIWTSKYEGILKYSHNESVRCLQFNPITGQLVSCANLDFGIWSPDQKSVIKHKISSPINCCAWSSDGHHLALGTNAGYISIRSRVGEEKQRIDKMSSMAGSIWGITFITSKDDETITFATADWSKSLTFFDISGKQLGKDRPLGFEPLSLQSFSNGDYLIISGTNREAILHSKDGITIGSIHKDSGWIWAAKPSPDGSKVAMSTQNGNLVVCELIFSTVHSLYRDRYAYRENMSDVIIQHLIKEEKVRIKCRDLVKKLAIFKNRLAIQLPERVVIYELISDDASPDDMQYKMKDKINQKFECTSLIVTSNCLVICTEKKLQCYSFKGHLEREWVLDSPIRYLKAIGGAVGRESMLIGLKSGQIVQIFINNPFPVSIVKINNPVRCLDLSMFRKKLAVVDDKNNLYVYDMSTKDLIYQEKNANSVTWNSQFEDMLCFSGSGNLSIKASDFPVHRQQLQGFVVGFCGAKVFCLNLETISFIEVSQSVSMYQYIERRQFKEAYQTACLKVTDYDWEQLAHGALDAVELDIAKKAFTRTRNYLYLELIHNYLVSGLTSNKSTEISFLGDVAAYRGQFSEAAKLYKQAGHDDKAVNMYTDLRMFDQAQDLVRSSDAAYKKQLAVKRADWVHNINEPRAAAEMYLSAGDVTKAIEIMGQHGWIDMLMGVIRNLDKGDHHNLSLCASYLIKHKQYFSAAEVYDKMGDHLNLAKVYVESNQWEEAFKLVNQYPDMKQIVYLPYAKWLAENDKFIEAQQAFHKAGSISEALNFLNQLMENAINERRFNDASYYCWILSTQCLELAASSSPESTKRAKLLDKFHQFQTHADIYFAYHNIHRYIEEPFTSFFPDALFSMARYLYHETLQLDLPGISKVSILYAFAKQGRNLGAFKLARLIYEKLHSLKIPSRFQEAIEMADVTIRAKPFSDSEDLLPLCYRCSTTNPLYNNKGNQCINCRQPYIFSFANFDILPLVEFILEDGLSEEEALKIINHESVTFKSLLQPKVNVKSANEGEGNWKEEYNSDYQALRFDDNDQLDATSYDLETGIERTSSWAEDPFTEQMATFQESDLDFKPIAVDAKLLATINPSDILVVKWPSPLKIRFYRNLMPDIQISLCQFCFRFFHTDELEMQILQHGHCPVCRNQSKLTGNI
ncbi:intraflagellar transport protein 122 homolog [Tetranychus urticae]|uniref:intraflagellar transport protein 122 homolog n=1 Tax=Tetranychus urticae TaxID=32264 RepID=UPI00077B8CB3|nr:intraflagellar transport protein 122 homolog [Tetranychus urticae]XP_025017397.1 intraflagellar transport protein 122 homolog [Tetranychus urticae]